MNCILLAPSTLTTLFLMVGGSAQAEPQPFRDHSPLAVLQPRPKDGVWDSLSISGHSRDLNKPVIIELLNHRGKLLSRAMVRPTAHTAGPRSFQARLAVPVQTGSLTGKLLVRHEGEAEEVAHEVPLVFQRAVLKNTTRLFHALGREEITLLKRWAGPRLFWLGVEGSKGKADNVVIIRKNMRPLLRWARRHRGAAIRQASVITNRHADGYSVVRLQLAHGYFDAGVTFEGRLHKVFATRHPGEWD